MRRLLLYTLLVFIVMFLLQIGRHKESHKRDWTSFALKDQDVQLVLGNWEYIANNIICVDDSWGIYLYPDHHAIKQEGQHVVIEGKTLGGVVYFGKIGGFSFTVVFIVNSATKVMPYPPDMVMHDFIPTEKEAYLPLGSSVSPSSNCP